jgi:hypothetical protein
MVELRGPDAMRMHHLWGTNGLVLELEMALAPGAPVARDAGVSTTSRTRWTSADKLANGPGIVKRERLFLRGADFRSPGASWPRPAQGLPHGCCRWCAESSEPAMLLVEAHGGTVGYRKTAAEVQKQQPHADGVHLEPHHAARAEVDKNLTYLQSAFIPGSTSSRSSRWKSCWAAR